MSKSIKLARFNVCPPDRTLGAIYLFGKGDQIILASMEPPWLDNKIGKSCLPPGNQYTVERRYTKKRGQHLLIGNTGKRRVRK